MEQLSIDNEQQKWSWNDCTTNVDKINFIHIGKYMRPLPYTPLSISTYSTI